MPFDPFGDYATRGYLRNINASKRPSLVKAAEYTSFRIHVEEAVTFLENLDCIRYDDVRTVHRTLFIGFYPWAGQDRNQLDVPDYIERGSVDFERSQRIELVMRKALSLGNDPIKIRAGPGEILGMMAFAHPFLEGNGRTLLPIHGELCRRAGIAIAWERTQKKEYLKALGREIQEPFVGHLDQYLSPFIVRARSVTRLLGDYRVLPGFGDCEQLKSRRSLATKPPASNGEVESTEKNIPRRRRIQS